MLILFLCLLLCDICTGDYSVRCNKSDGLSFEEAGDGVEGRYRVEWCTGDRRATGSATWSLSLRSKLDRQPEDCRHYNKSQPSADLHSYFSEDVNITLNCQYVCLSTNLDLIFNGTCYYLKIFLRPKRSNGYISNNYVQYVRNNYPKKHFSKSQAVVAIKAVDDHVNATWFLGYVPATKYYMTICTLVDNEPSCASLTQNCSVASGAPTSIECALWPPPRAYQLQLDHDAPWCSGEVFFSRLVHLTHNSSSYVTPPVVTGRVSTGGGAEWWWAGGVALALAAGGLAALALCRSHLAAKLRERVERDWLNRRAGAGAGTSAAAGMSAAAGAGAAAGEDGEAGGRRVLLLYARDCAPMMAVAAQLRELLLHVVDHVHDIYSAETVAAAARAPGEWLRRAVARPDTRVLLLQSRAAACLHAPALRARGARLLLEQPLLNRRAVYRAPHSSDALLPLALRLLADAAHADRSYKKYYVATVEGLEAELVEAVTPLRRYSLPAGAALLLRDLAPEGTFPPLITPGGPTLGGPSPLAAQLQRFTEAVRALHDYVRRKPDYLDEELIFFDYDT